MNLFFTFFILVYFCVFHSMGVICGIILKTQVRMSGLHYEYMASQLQLFYVTWGFSYMKAVFFPLSMPFEMSIYFGYSCLFS